MSHELESLKSEVRQQGYLIHTKANDEDVRRLKGVISNQDNRINNLQGAIDHMENKITELYSKIEELTTLR